MNEWTNVKLMKEKSIIAPNKLMTKKNEWMNELRPEQTIIRKQEQTNDQTMDEWKN